MTPPVSRTGVAAQPRRSAIGICASTGGPAALEQVLGGLPADFDVPLLIVQHIAISFTEGLVRQLDDSAAIPVAIATHGVPLQPGAWFAPDDTHLTVTRGRRIALDPRTVVGRHRPSADVLLESLAAAFGSAAVAVILTGMGRDGARGAAAVKAAGGTALAQDEESSGIYGMPRAATEAGARAVPLGRIAGVLRQLTEVRR